MHVEPIDIWLVDETKRAMHLVNVANYPCRIANHQCSRWDTTCHNGARAYHRIFTDRHASQDRRVDADASAVLDGWALHAACANWMRIVGNHDTRAKEDVVFDDRVLSNIDVVVDPHAVADDTAIVNCGVIPNRDRK